LITIQTLLQTATPADQAEGKQEADEQYTNLVKKFISPEAFQHQLQAVGVTVEDLRNKATQEAVAKSALKRELNINITDDEAKTYYTEHPSDFEQPELIHVRHILLMTIDPSTRPPTPLSTNAIAQKRKQIENIRQQIVSGADFATLAKQYSEDPGSKEQGGELRQFSRGEMVPEFESAAFALQTNQVSDVITSQYGFHIIKLLDKTPAKKIDFATADQEIKDGLTQQKIRKLAPPLIKKLRADQQVQILDPDLKSMEAQLEAQAAASEAMAPDTSTNK
jgi:parvulin-like peptidyl-prolyl isomerase